ncbi:MAG: hypothetical protein L6R48_17945 [Planctomycetes bacterium]|nr:hypothetical protein [Planctomycetota bacterium]
MRPLALAALLLATPLLMAADKTPAEAPASTSAAIKKTAPKIQSLALTLIAEEEQWEFRPPVGRIDPFFDREAVLRIDRAIKQIQADSPGTPSGKPDTSRDVSDALAWATAELDRIESLVAQRHFEDALKSTEAAAKRLDRFANEAGVDKVIVRLKVFRDQALEALIRNEAQAAFDALALRIDGILWAENGTRLAIMRGEPRAVGVNDRVKDCTVINIDTDRVDFRFHYRSSRSEQSRRFEFPRYVGEDSKSSKR